MSSGDDDGDDTWGDGQVTKDTKAKGKVFSLKDILVAQAFTLLCLHTWAFLIKESKESMI